MIHPQPIIYLPHREALVEGIGDKGGGGDPAKLKTRVALITKYNLTPPSFTPPAQN